MKSLLKISIVLLACCLLSPFTAMAQTTTAASQPLPADVATAPEYKVPPAQTSYPMLRLSPDKPQIIRLEGDARSVLVGNPAHLNVILDNTRMLVLVPRDPGATYFTVIDHDGKVIMERYVIVAGPAHKYIRIRRTCPAGTGTGCTATSVYYCPDLCYETEIMSAAQGQAAATPAPPPAGTPVGGTGAATPDTTAPAIAPSPVH